MDYKENEMFLKKMKKNLHSNFYYVTFALIKKELIKKFINKLKKFLKWKNRKI